MFYAEADKQRQLLTTTFRGHVTAEELNAGLENVKRLINEELQPGFRILGDLSGLETMELSCAPYIRQIMDAANERGVEEVVRVISNPRQDIGFNVMSRFHYDPKVRLATYETLEEALQSLDT